MIEISEPLYFVKQCVCNFKQLKPCHEKEKLFDTSNTFFLAFLLHVLVLIAYKIAFINFEIHINVCSFMLIVWRLCLSGSVSQI